MTRPATPRLMKTEIEIDIQSDHNFWSAGLSMDVAEGGVFVATHYPLALGTRVVVKMSLPFEKEPIVAHGRVTWMRPYLEDSEMPPGVGLRFVEIEPGMLDKLRRFASEVRDPIFFAA